MIVYAVDKDHRRIADETHANMLRHRAWMKTEFAKVAQEQPDLERREQFRVLANRWLGNTLPPTPQRDRELKAWGQAELDFWNMLVDEKDGVHRPKTGGITRLNKIIFNITPHGKSHIEYADIGPAPAPGLPN